MANRIRELIEFQTALRPDKDGKFDDADWEVPDLLVMKSVSKNNRRYTEQFMEDVASLLDGMPLADGHEDLEKLTKGKEARDWKEKFGTWRKGKRIGERVQAGVKLNPKHPSSSTFREICRDPDFHSHACISIEFDDDNTEWTWDAKNNETVFHRCREMLPPCVVSDGGTTKTVYESDQSRRKPEMADSNSVAEIVEKRFQESEAKRKLDQELADLRSQNRTLREENESFQSRIKEFEAKDEERKKLSRIKEMATKEFQISIGDDHAEDLVPLAEERIRARLKEHAEMLKRSGIRVTESESPIEFGAPSVTTQSASDYDEEMFRRLCEP